MLRRWFWNVLIAFDQLGNSLGGGDPDETISSRAAKEKARGARWGCMLCRMLDVVDPGHCDKSIEPDEGRNATFNEGE